MDLKAKIKADIERHEVMACYDLHTAISIIDFVALAQSDNDSEAGYHVDNGVATIDVRGLLVPTMTKDYSDWGITGYNHIAEYIERANADPMVNSIVLDIDSGGGYVRGIDLASEAIYQSDKPVTTFASGDMYSAAYWLGATADKVTATKTSGIGSIGVVRAHFEHSKELEQRGITPTFIRSGKWKAVFNSAEPLTDEQKQRLQEGVDESASIFFNHVAACRGLDAKTIAAWQGDTFNAQTAKDYGLIDAIEKHAPVSQTTSNQLSQEDIMDLAEAQAKIATLEAEKSQEEQARQAAEERAKAVEDKLKDAQMKAREAQINELAQITGVEISDDKKAVYASMTDEQFAIVLEDAKAAKASAPALPDHLFQDTAVQGKTDIKGSGIDAEFERAKREHANKSGGRNA